jgi:hypothetical protein
MHLTKVPFRVSYALESLVHIILIILERMLTHATTNLWQSML